MKKVIEEIYGPGATINDAPWNRPILAEDREAIKKAGEEGRTITELTDKAKQVEKNDQAKQNGNTSE